MGDNSNKSGKDSEDLLSKLFEMDDKDEGPNPFAEPTKVDQTAVVSKKSAADLLQFDDQRTTASEPKDELPEDLFKGILDDENPDPISLISPEEVTSVGIDAPQRKESNAQEDVTEDEVTDLGQFAESMADTMNDGSAFSGDSQTLTLDSNVLEEEPLVPLPKAKQESSTTEKLVSAKSIDPIDDALAQFEEIPPAPSQAKKNVGRQLEVASDDDFSSSSDLSLNRSSASGLRPVEAARQSSVIQSALGKVPPKVRRVGLFSAVAMAVVVSGFLTIQQFKTDAGLFGYRLEGFSFVKAYRAPSESDLAEFLKVFEDAKQSRFSDDPKRMELAVSMLKGVLSKDERNVEGLSQLMETAARLMGWYGLKSPWPIQFDEAQRQLTALRERFPQLPYPLAATRALGWRALAVEDYSRAFSDLASFHSSSDSEMTLLIAEVAFYLGKTEEASKALGRIQVQDSPRSRLIQALIKNDMTEIKSLSLGGYLPARLEEVIKSPKSRESSEQLISAANNLKTALQDYPVLLARLGDYLGDLYALQENPLQARDFWKQALAVMPKAGVIWMKLAESYEYDAQWDEALAAYRSAEKAKVLTEGGYLRFSKLLRLRGKVVDALTLLEDFIKANPKSFGAHVEKGLVYVSIYQDEQAKGEFLKALELNSSHEPALLGLVQISLARRDFVEAESLLKKIPPTSPQYAETLLSIARIAAEQNRFKEAEDSYLKAINKNSQLEPAYFELSQQYLFDEKDAQAEELLARGLKALPRSPLLRISMAKIHQFRGNLDRALTDIQSVQKSFDHLPIVNFALVDLYIDRKEMAKAYDVLSKLDAATSKDPEVSYLKTKAFNKEPENPNGVGSAESAMRLIDGALRKKPDDVRYRLAAAQVALLLQDKKTATEHVDSVLQTRPKFAPALTIRADFYRDSGDYENAIPLYEEALKHTRFKAEIFKRLAEGYKILGKPGLAVQFYQKVTQANPKDAAAFLELGKLYSDDGNYSAALKALRTSVQLNPEVSEAYYFLGFVHKELGNKKDAISSFDRFLVLAPEGKESSTIRDEVYFLKNGSRSR